MSIHADVFAKEMEEAEMWYDFGPVDPPSFCDKDYPGIETTFQEGAAHRWVI